MGESRSTVLWGTASVFFEKSNDMLRVARGTCTRGGHGKRPMRQGCDRCCSSEVSESTTNLPVIAVASNMVSYTSPSTYGMSYNGEFGEDWRHTLLRCT